MKYIPRVYSNLRLYSIIHNHFSSFDGSRDVIKYSNERKNEAKEFNFSNSKFIRKVKKAVLGNHSLEF